MADKIFRDPLYNYINIDRERDRWLIRLLDCPEAQRLRRIHQLGVSHVTYPGARYCQMLWIPSGRACMNEKGGVP